MLIKVFVLFYISNLVNYNALHHDSIITLSTYDDIKAAELFLYMYMHFEWRQFNMVLYIPINDDSITKEDGELRRGYLGGNVFLK